MKIMVTGASGMLGQDLCPILEDIGVFVIPINSSILDITDKNAAENFIQNAHPDIIIHCAAYTNVDKAQSDSKNAYKINRDGTRNIAIAADKINALMIYISTDYVFDGTKNTPYTPKDKTNPQNVYGSSKLAGEQEVIKHCKKYYIARTSWLYGHKGKNFVETMISLAQKPELKVVDDQTGCPTWTVAPCRAVIKLISGQKPYGIYHTCGGGYTSWYGFAKEIFKLAGINANLKPCTTDEFPRDAKRPKFSVMDNDGICPDWKLSLKEYIEMRG